MKRLALVAAILAVLVVGLLAPAGPAVAGDYDHLFSKWGKRWFGQAVDWKWFAAQARAESSLDPEAVSPVGARGLMQIMPGTSRELAARLGLPDRPLDPRTAVAMGIYYDRRLWDFWSAPRPELARLRLALASYNAGPGNILKAQRLAQAAGRGGALWLDVAEFLPEITGHHSKETIGYVSRIERLFRALSVRAID